MIINNKKKKEENGLLIICPKANSAQNELQTLHQHEHSLSLPTASWLLYLCSVDNVLMFQLVLQYMCVSVQYKVKTERLNRVWVLQNVLYM